MVSLKKILDKLIQYNSVLATVKYEQIINYRNRCF